MLTKINWFYLSRLFCYYNFDPLNEKEYLKVYSSNLHTVS